MRKLHTTSDNMFIAYRLIMFLQDYYSISSRLNKKMIIGKNYIKVIFYYKKESDRSLF